MEITSLSEKFSEWQMSEGYVRCLGKAIERTHRLLVCEASTPDSEQVHAVKSVLYAAIERAWLESERLLGVQRMLRELLMLTTVRSAPEPGDREQALRILGRLTSFSERSQISNLKSKI